jgi:hypothetical protein
MKKFNPSNVKNAGIAYLWMFIFAVIGAVYLWYTNNKFLSYGTHDVQAWQNHINKLYAISALFGIICCAAFLIGCLQLIVSSSD